MHICVYNKKSAAIFANLAGVSKKFNNVFSQFAKKCDCGRSTYKHKCYKKEIISLRMDSKKGLILKDLEKKYVNKNTKVPRFSFNHIHDTEDLFNRIHEPEVPFGKTYQIPIQENGDFVHHMYIKLSLPSFIKIYPKAEENWQLICNLYRAKVQIVYGYAFVNSNEEIDLGEEIKLKDFSFLDLYESEESGEESDEKCWHCAGTYIKKCKYCPEKVCPICEGGDDDCPACGGLSKFNMSDPDSSDDECFKEYHIGIGEK